MFAYDILGRLYERTMNAKQESEKLMNAVLPLAEKMLRQHGEFYPYGGYMKPDGTIVDVGADDPDTDRPKSKDLLYVLRSSFREMASAYQCKAVAVVFDVAVNLPNSNRKRDAIQVCIDHAAGYSVEVFFPYQIVINEIVYEEPMRKKGNTRFLNRVEFVIKASG
jgi:hypothetical protein